MSFKLLGNKQKQLDRALYERSLAQAVAKDIPDYYERLHQIALAGEDADSLKAILALFDRLLGKPKDESQLPSQALTINVVNSFGGSVEDYRISRYSPTLGGVAVDPTDPTNSKHLDDPTDTDPILGDYKPNSLPPLARLAEPPLAAQVISSLDTPTSHDLPQS